MFTRDPAFEPLLWPAGWLLRILNSRYLCQHTLSSFSVIIGSFILSQVYSFIATHFKAACKMLDLIF